MADRKKDERLQELYDQGISPYSISKLNAMDGCYREAFYTYKQKDRGSKNIYGVMGTSIHEALEKIYNDEADGDCLLDALQNDLTEVEMLGIDFPRDFKGGTQIRDNWVTDMTNFCETFEKMEGDFVTEELVILKISDTRYLIGYVDLIKIVDEDTKEINIYDFKTSSKFKAEDLIHHGRQLVAYGMAKEQAGYKVGTLAWIMLKYVEVEYQGYKRANSKNKSTIHKIIQRSKLPKELSPVIRNRMTEMGYNEIDTDIILSKFEETCSMNTIPSEIRDEFSVKQYVEYYPFSEENKAEVMDYINTRADVFEKLWGSDEENDWKPVEVTDKQSFYCNNLCSHRFRCPEIKKYNDLKKLNEIDEGDLF